MIGTAHDFEWSTEEYRLVINLLLFLSLRK